MAFCGYMDPLNWTYRFYLLESIEKAGFEKGWEEIISCMNKLTTTLLNTPFTITPKQCHLFYLQMLAEFGDFRSYSDPLALPSKEIRDKIRQMRRAELRHELIMANNQIRYNNCLIRHHGGNLKVKSENPHDTLQWLTFAKEEDNPQPITDVLSHVAASIKTCDFFKHLPRDAKGTIGLKDMTIDNIVYRCVTGVVSTPMDLIRDIFHLCVNLYLSNMSEKEKNAVAQMKMYVLNQLSPYLNGDPEWERVRGYVEGVGADKS